MSGTGLMGPVFLVGCPRSGTTLLQRLLDAHPEVAVAPETFFCRNFWKRRREFGDLGQDENLGRLLEKICGMPEFAEMGLSREKFQVAAEGTRSLEGLFQLLFEQFARLRGARVVGEKTPNHLLYMRTLERLFPGARFVQIVRDPRAVASSWRKVPWSNGTLSGDAETWRKYQAAARRRPPRRAGLHTLRYEELVRAPETVLGGVCDFIGIPFDETMLEFHRSRNQAVDAQREPWKQEANSPLTDRRAEGWREELTPAEVRQIEAVTWYEMRRAGYDPESSFARLLPGMCVHAFRRGLKAIRRWRR
ncbi:MAG: sulfotransferase [Planctomycetota bacterium]